MKGFVYIIRSHQTDKVYYGSTKQRLSQRMTEHRCQYKRYIDGNETIFRSVNHLVKYDDAYIELIEEFEYENKQQLKAREGHYIRNNDCVNKEIAGRTQKEWCDENRDKIQIQKYFYHLATKEQKQKYYNDNKEAISKRRKEIYKNKKAISE